MTALNFTIELFCRGGRQMHNTTNHPLIEEQAEMISLAECTNQQNLKICRKGRWNDRMVVETIFSLCTTVLGLNNSLTDCSIPSSQNRLNLCYFQSLSQLERPK